MLRKKILVGQTVLDGGSLVTELVDVGGNIIGGGPFEGHSSLKAGDNVYLGTLGTTPYQVSRVEYVSSEGNLIQVVTIIH